MRRLRSLLYGLILSTVCGAALVLLQASDTAAQDDDGPTTTSNCSPFLDRYGDPTELELGETSKIVLNVEPLCPEFRKPVDLIFLVDVSNSMTRGTPGGGNTDPGDPPPGNTDPGDPPPKEPPPPPGPVPPEPPAEPLAFRLNPALASMVPFGNTPNQEEPPEKPEPEPPTDPGGSNSRNNPNAEPPGCGGNDATAPGGGNTDPGDPDPPGNTDPPVPPTPRVTPDPGNPPPEKTEVPPGGNIGGPPSDLGGPQEETEPAGSEDLIRDAQRFVRDFFGQDQIKEDLAGGALRVGMVSFNKRGRRLVSLTDQGNRAATRTSLLRGGGLTRIDIGLRTAERALQDRNYRYGILHRNDRTKVIVVISDGGFCDRDLRARVAKEIEIVGLFAGRGPYQRRMRDIVTENEYLLDLNSRGLKDLMFIYDKDFVRGEQVNMDKLDVVEQLSDTMELVPGSVSQGGVVDGNKITWSFEPPATALTVSYEVKPLQEGYLMVTDASDANWTDSKALIGSQPFPDVRLSVNYDPPTATPTPVPPTDTPVPPTATPEIVLRPAYLPVAYRQENKPPPTEEPCEPSRQKVDIAIVIDTSVSMSDITTPGGPRKLDAAVDAAKALVGQLKFASGNQDQATVIGFNAAATAFVPLTFDRTTVESALDLLKANQAPGTRIDLGLAKAREILNGNNARDVATQTIVLVTDAQQSEVAGGAQAVRDEANRVRADGISLFTVGLGEGEDIDEALLREIATRPEFYTHAPDASTLQQIYLERIAPLVPCP